MKIKKKIQDEKNATKQDTNEKKIRNRGKKII